MRSIDCSTQQPLLAQPDKVPQGSPDEGVQYPPLEPFIAQVEKDSSRMETVWKRTMHQQYQVSDRYDHVAALIVRWDDELDRDLQCKHEVEELNNLFKDDFHFNSRVLKLDTRSRPQSQLNHAVAELVHRDDGPSRKHLLIVYYSGHGVARGDGHLGFAGVPKDPCPVLEGGGRYLPMLKWTDAERDLDLAEADVLIVLDCCCAAMIMNKELSDDARSHEVIAATGRLQKTNAPGSRSFTRYFIDALKEELEKNNRQPFNTYDLNAEITRRRMLRTPYESRIFNRHANARNRRHIALAPLDHIQPVTPEQAVSRPKRAREAATLDLQISFSKRTRLADHEVKQLATKMFEAAKSTDLDIISIDWMEFKPRKEVVQLQQTLRVLFYAIYYFTRWRQIVRRNKKRKAEGAIDDDQPRPTKRPAISTFFLEQPPNSYIEPLSPPPSSRSDAESPQP
ncbi:hypothetical protein LTR37_000726 [Vermiconidia calcicola]|uniref:Uncharacterized protein n=1 Tax=Vermiconidia calcicola TaxID=1690605 RepID=A0ACC3NYE7_9PEZI|nr:hypothetical protein LTR37_000726 [Vermiconidia calcicola]